MDSGQHRWDDRPGQFVDQFSELRVFLRGPADHGKGPDRIVAMIDAFHFHYGKFVSQTVITKVIAKRSFWFDLAGFHSAADGKIGFTVNGEWEAAGGHGDPVSAQGPSKGQFRHAFRQRHDRGKGHCWCAANKHVDGEIDFQIRSDLMMHTDASVDLVVQSDLFVFDIVVSTHLDAIHAEVRVLQAFLLRNMTVDLWESHKGPTIVRPAFHLWQVTQATLIL